MSRRQQQKDRYRSGTPMGGRSASTGFGSQHLVSESAFSDAGRLEGASYNGKDVARDWLGEPNIPNGRDSDVNSIRRPPSETSVRDPLVPRRPPRTQEPWFDLRKFIFSSMGVPPGPATCAWFVYYFFMMLSGIVLGALSGVSVGEFDRDSQLTVARVLCMLVGAFFIVVFMYWFLLLMWWMFIKDRNNCVDFSCLAFVWWLLSFIYGGLFFSLLTETLDSKKTLKLRDYFNYTCTTVDNMSGACFYFVVPYALFSMALFQFIYFILFLKLLWAKCLKKRA